MKKIKIVMAIVLCVVFMTVPAWSQPYTYADPIDSIVALDTGNPSEANEKSYLADYLGLTVPQVDALYIFDKNEAIGTSDYKDLNFGLDYAPFSWDYAIVKVDGPNDYWYLFMDDNASGLLSGGDDVLTTPVAGTCPYNMGDPPLGISHVTWFRTTTQQVPEPMTLLLFGMGLIGLAGFGRRFRKE